MKKMFRITGVLLALALTAALFGCSGGGTDSGTTTAANTTVAETVKYDPIAKDDIKIGVIHITSTKDVQGYTAAHHAGIMKMQEELGLKDGQIMEIDEVYDDQPDLINNALDELINAKCDVIFATSWGYMDYMEAAAAKYPDIIFSHCSGYKSNGKNFNNYFGRIYEARYLSGIAAGMKLKELMDADDKVQPVLGFVAAQDSSNAEVTGGINAFALGAQSVVPDAVVKVSVTGSWYDPLKETAAAKALIDAGAKVIGQHCDTENPQLEAQKNKVFGVGYNSDMTIKDKTDKAHIVAPVWDWGVYYTYAVKSVIDGTWDGKDYYEGYNKGLVGLSALNEAVAAEGTKEALEAAIAKIKAGSLFVFTGPLFDNTGKEVLAAGKKLTDAEITGKINYYLKGVEKI